MDGSDIHRFSSRKWHAQCWKSVNIITCSSALPNIIVQFYYLHQYTDYLFMLPSVFSHRLPNVVEKPSHNSRMSSKRTDITDFCQDDKVTRQNKGLTVYILMQKIGNFSIWSITKPTPILNRNI